MEMNKRGQVFTSVTIALIILFFVVYETTYLFEDRSAIRSRVNTMDNFLFSMEKNLERQMYITGYRSIFLAEDTITKTGEYLPSYSKFFDEAFFNGTVNGLSSEILFGYNYSTMESFIMEKGRNINVNVSMKHPSFLVTQEDPWNVALILKFNITIEDLGGVASWEKKEEIKSLISIEGFEDPLTILTSNVQKINVTSYVVNSSAPNFLNRLEGTTYTAQGDTNGISPK